MTMHIAAAFLAEVWEDQSAREVPLSAYGASKGCLMNGGIRYVSAAYLAERTGLSMRYFQKYAARERPKWAHQPGGEGTAWRFDEAAFWKWFKSDKRWQRPIADPTRRSSGGGSRTKAKNTVSPLKQRLIELRKSGC
jgi:hypothetical protein